MGGPPGRCGGGRNAGLMWGSRLAVFSRLVSLISVALAPVDGFAVITGLGSGRVDPVGTYGGEGDLLAAVVSDWVVGGAVSGDGRMI